MSIVSSCDFGSKNCKNSIENAGEDRNKCLCCNLAPENVDDLFHYDYYKPVIANTKHPILERRKTQDRMDNANERAEERLNVDRKKRKVLSKAVIAEEKTNKVLDIKATKNSGRVNKDGDHQAGDFISLDTKNQSQRENPIIRLHELEKIRKDAGNAGNPLGGLLLRNKAGLGFIVFTEQDFKDHILSRL